MKIHVRFHWRGEIRIFMVAAVVVVLFILMALLSGCSISMAHTADEKYNAAWAKEIEREATEEDRQMGRSLCQLFKDTGDPVGVLNELVQDTGPELSDLGAQNMGRWVRISIESYCPEYKGDMLTWVALHD